MKTYAKPDLIVHGNVEEITLNTGRTMDTDFIILTGLPGGTVNAQGNGGCLDFQRDTTSGGGGFVPSDPND